jgi:PKD repeat protein
MRIAAVLALIILALSALVGCGSKAPRAEFSATPLIGHPPLEIQFTDKSTGNITAWEWDLNGDGVPDSNVRNPEYTYEIPGNYTVSLTVTGPDGNNTVVKKDYVQVTRCYLADFTIESVPGNCEVQGNGTSCEGATTVHFIDKSTGNVTAWAWDFNNDGTIDSTQQNPTYTYTQNGNYTVTLTITTPECKDSVTKWDYINLSGCHT